MSRKLRDRKCLSCKTVYLDEFCEDDHSCSCGEKTVSYFPTVEERGGTPRDAETPIVFGGVRYSPSEFKAFRSEWKAIHHEELNVSGDSPRARKARLEETLHNTIVEARQRGGFQHTIDHIEKAGARIR